jgi:hypothetical protein
MGGWDYFKYMAQPTGFIEGVMKYGEILAEKSKPKS